MTDISRRSFLTAAGLGAATLGVTAIAGCSTPAKSGSGSSAATTTSASGKPNFAIEAVKVSAAGNPVQECDYLVIGGGNCGMMSAAHAAELGLNTIVLEKSEKTGGSSIGTEVTMAFSDNKIMNECKDDPEVINVTRPAGTKAEIFNYFMMHNSWKADPQLVRNFIDNNYRYHDFLYENGGYPQMLLPSLDSPTCGIMYKGQGIGAHEVMQKAAEKYGAKILTATPAEALVVDDKGAVVGAMAKVDGKSGYIKSKAVFVGTGGFSGNSDMVNYYIPGYGSFAWKNDAQIKHDGDGIRMMLGAGAAESDMSLAQPAASSVEGVVWEDPIDKAAREPYLWVNNQGERLGNEKWNVMDTMFKVGVKEAGHVYYNVIDSDAAKRMETENFMTSCRTVLGDPGPVANMTEALEAGVKAGTVYKGETLADLAKAAGINEKGLEETVKRYNDLAAKGEDTDFFKDKAALFPVAKAPFYAFKLIPSWYSTLCGVKINGNINAVREDGSAIPGLYAGGLDSGEFFKDDYNHGFSGSCSGYSYFTGYFAADKAKEYIDGAK